MRKADMYKLPPLNVLELGMVINAWQAHRNNLMREGKTVEDIESAYKKAHAAYPTQRIVKDDSHVI